MAHRYHDELMRTSPRTAAEAAAPAFARPSACRIRLWQGYIKKQFYAEPSGGGSWLAESPFFRLDRGQTVAECEAARDALVALVAALQSQGWEVAGRGAAPWDIEMRRPTGAWARPPRQHHQSQS